MAFAPNQVLRTKIPLRINGVQIPTGTRVRALRPLKPSQNVGSNKGKVKVVIADPHANGLNGQKVIASPGAFRTTVVGRPEGALGPVLVGEEAPTAEE